MDLDRNSLTVLERDECLRLLAGARLGRIGLTSGALPVVLPVNFFLDVDRILVRTGYGTKLEAASRNTVVAFEVDDFDPFDHSGWSVVVTGMARVIDDPAELEDLATTPIPRWAPGDDERIIAISTEMVTGRRLGV
ncbi:MAG TPA: pyridoxamine 5'-phosphate oxidase family protein [Acidimicrobiales bacterium]|nr:pyridoxamine 5'-phosphate oxidase family protein [Acidimicrobiales bacterium]